MTDAGDFEDDEPFTDEYKKEIEFWKDRECCLCDKPGEDATLRFLTTRKKDHLSVTYET